MTSTFAKPSKIKTLKFLNGLGRGGEKCAVIYNKKKIDTLDINK